MNANGGHFNHESVMAERGHTVMTVAKFSELFYPPPFYPLVTIKIMQTPLLLGTPSSPPHSDDVIYVSPLVDYLATQSSTLRNSIPSCPFYESCVSPSSSSFLTAESPFVAEFLWLLDSSSGQKHKAELPVTRSVMP